MPARIEQDVLNSSVGATESIGNAEFEDRTRKESPIRLDSSWGPADSIVNRYCLACISGSPLGEYRYLHEVSEVTRPWRIVNILRSSSKGLSSGIGGGTSVLIYARISTRRRSAIRTSVARSSTIRTSMGRLSAGPSFGTRTSAARPSRRRSSAASTSGEQTSVERT